MSNAHIVHVPHPHSCLYTWINVTIQIRHQCSFMARESQLHFNRAQKMGRGILAMPIHLDLAIAVLILVLSSPLLLIAWSNYHKLMGHHLLRIAIQSGETAIASVPVLLALGSGANTVSSMSGISCKKLVSFYRWVLWLSLVLSFSYSLPLFWQTLSYFRLRGFSKLKSGDFTSGHLTRGSEVCICCNATEKRGY